MYYLTPPPSPPRETSPKRKSSPTRLSPPTRSALTPPSSRDSSPASVRSPPQHQFSKRQTSPPRLPPKALHRILSHYLTREKRINRISKAKQITLQNTRLRLSNQRLQTELAHLRASATKSQEEISHLLTSNTNLQNEKSELKRTIILQKPLLKIGVDIRKRFLEKTRSGRYHKPERADIVNEGNKAAHNCCVAADAALFELGYMDAEEGGVVLPREYFGIGGDGKVRVEKVEKGQRVGMRYRDLFYDLYGREAREAGECVWGERERRVWDLIGTMVSCCEGFELGEMESGDDWFDRFNELVEEINWVKKDIEEQCEHQDERVQAFEASDEVDAMLKEMGDIVEETRLWSWRRDRTVLGDGRVERAIEVGMDEKRESDEVNMNNEESSHETEVGKDYDILMAE